MDRIERHDFVNAVLLAVVLLGMAFALVATTRALFDTVDEGLVEAEKPEETVPTTVPSTTTTPADEVTSTTAPPRLPSEVEVRVGNGANKSGVAGAATDILASAGYVTLGPKNSTIKLDISTVYYMETFGADAEVIATLLNIPTTNTAPMPADTGVPQDTATVIVILGADTTL